MKRYAVIIMLVCVWFAVAGCFAAETIIFPKIDPVPAPEFIVQKEGGAEPIRLSDLKGKMVILHFWATWCTPCIGELPALAQRQNEFSEDKLVVVAIPVGAKSFEDVGRFFEEKKIKGPKTWLDPERKAMTLFKLNSLPATIIVGRDGKIIYRTDRPVGWKDPEVGDFIGRLVKG